MPEVKKVFSANEKLFDSIHSENGEVIREKE